jgi:hypothetical protein
LAVLLLYVFLHHQDLAFVVVFQVVQDLLAFLHLQLHVYLVEVAESYDF